MSYDVVFTNNVFYSNVRVKQRRLCSVFVTWPLLSREENGTLCRLVFELVYPTKLNRLLVQYIDDTLVSKTIVFKHRTKFKRHNINKEGQWRTLC